MKNTFGQNVCVTIFGESHGCEIGAVLDGLCAGVPVDMNFVNKMLTLRRPAGKISTGRKEKDEFRFVSGIKDGYTTGAPICVIIENTDADSADYAEISNIFRPGHADYTASVKYGGYNERSGGGHISGRLTAPIVALGAIAIDALKQKGIYIGTHILNCAEISDRGFDDYKEDILSLYENAFPTLSRDAEEKIKSAIADIANEGDSIGGLLETAIYGVPCGVGSDWFGSLEGMISSAVFGIPAVKGISFGDGFDICRKRGSQANDQMQYNNGNLTFLSNHNGGISGGISNGMPIIVNTAIKPTPSIKVPQKTVNAITKENEEISVKGRHDACIAHRAAPIISSVCALVLCDALTQKFGDDWLIG